VESHAIPEKLRTQFNYGTGRQDDEPNVVQLSDGSAMYEAMPHRKFSKRLLAAAFDWRERPHYLRSI
jgi:hypothetical protein